MYRFTVGKIAICSKYKRYPSDRINKKSFGWVIPKKKLIVKIMGKKNSFFYLKMLDGVEKKTETSLYDYKSNMQKKYYNLFTKNKFLKKMPIEHETIFAI